MKNKISQTAPIGIISLSGNYELSIKDLQVPERIIQIVQDIQKIYPQKRKLDFNDFNLILSHENFDDDIAMHLSQAIINADQQTALKLWDSFNYRIKYSTIVFDDSVLNLDLVKKLDLEGGLIRTAFLSKGSITPPDKTPYTYINGDTSVEAAHQLVSLLLQMQKMKPEGQILIDEFFDGIDIRILYLMVISEAEWFEDLDTEGGAYLQLAVESNDCIPNQALLLSWIQENAPETFLLLRAELLNPVWSENRTMFWKGWIRQNRPELDPDYYEKKKPPAYLGRVQNGENADDVLDELLNLSERDTD